MQVSSARISAIVHATEDLEKVILALQQTRGPKLSRTEPEKRILKGHFGNQITTLTLTVRGREAESSLANIWRELSCVDRDILLRELDNRLDEDGRFHLRLDKQRCFQGTLQLRDQDPVKLEFSIRRSAERKDFERLLLSLESKD